VASRAHLEAMVPVLEGAFAKAGVKPADIDAVAVTAGPGLAGALMVGVAAAKAYAYALGKPLYGVNHLAAHVAVDQLEHGPLPAPCVALLVSGGHSSLLLVPDVTGEVRSLGSTIDDAAGEAYDKVAKLLGLGYPGGPALDRLAGAGDDRAVALPTTRLTHADRNAPELKGDLDFSFSGLKTAVLRHVRAHPPTPEGSGAAAALTDAERADIAASFQRVVVTVLIERLFEAARRHGAKSVGIAGGVSANSRLRAELEERGRRREIPTFLPSLALSTDNAAMIAAAGLRRFRVGHIASLDLNADAALTLG
jgi:N6-L-threonylcarbamoyladenine synthase